jgi:HAD superfamily hydrolase (TIGR01509 family)
VNLAELSDPEGLVFDLDGTLVDTVETRIRAWLETLEEAGLPADREHVARLIGADGRRLAREVAAVAGRELEAERAEAIDRRAGEVYGRLNTEPRPLPGARQLLLTLEGSYLPWAIATSSRAEQVQASVDALGLTRPPLVVDGSHVKHAKPAPDLLFRAAERLSAPAQGCWCVGDSTWDMLAAEAAAMAAVGVPTGAAPAQALLDAGATAVTSLEALAAELRRRGLAPRRQTGSS